MKATALLFCALLVAAPLAGCIFRGEGNKKNSDSRDRTPPEDTIEVPDGREIPLPVAVESEDSSINIKFNLIDGCRGLEMDSSGENLLIISTLDGEFSRSENQMAVQSADGSLKLVFELAAGQTIHLQNGQQAQKGQLLAETSEPLLFYVEEEGQRLKQKLNIYNEAKEYVTVSESGRGCPP